MADLNTPSSSIFDAPRDTTFNKPPPKGRKAKGPKKSAISEVVASGLNPTTDSAQFRDTTIALGISAEGQALREATKPNFIERVGAAMSGNTDARIVKGFGRLLSGYSAEFDDVAELDYQAPKRHWLAWLSVTYKNAMKHVAVKNLMPSLAGRLTSSSGYRT